MYSLTNTNVNVTNTMCHALVSEVCGLVVSLLHLSPRSVFKRSVACKFLSCVHLWTLLFAQLGANLKYVC
jgi:hypothetical protein